MRPAQIAVLVVALAAGGVAAMMIAGREAAPPPPPAIQAPAPVATTDVLVAAGDLPVGKGVKAEDLRWQPWPSDIVPPGSVTRTKDPEAIAQNAGTIVRHAILAGEPIRPEKLIKSNSGFLSAILPQGMRAVAISVDVRGASSAGGFILPNDRVDVIRTSRDEEASRIGGSDVTTSQTVLQNVRVLAVGQNVQEQNNEKVVTGETVTLEVTPSQAEILTLAQKVGQLSLTLRSIADANAPKQDVSHERGNLTVIRYGVAKQNPTN